MWQRIQTLYLAISAGLIVAIFFTPYAEALDTNESIYFTDKLPYLWLMISVILAHIFTLTLFKARGLQFRVTTLAALITLGFQIWVAVDFFNRPDGIVFKMTAVFPLASVILDVLALRGIMSDILITESVGRLRSRRKNGKK